jgi:hypothetical protein
MTTDNTPDSKDLGPPWLQGSDSDDDSDDYDTVGWIEDCDFVCGLNGLIEVTQHLQEAAAEL